jgi:parallel beta-helix repeat protein
MIDLKKIVLLAFILVVLSLVLFLESPTPIKAHPANMIVPDDYERIQQAIDRARNGDTIFVRAGLYYENVIVNERVSLIGENRFNTIIDGNFTGNVIEVAADNVTITDFTIQNSGSTPSCGICVRQRSTGNNISHNIIANNRHGIVLNFDSEYNSMSRNNIRANKECGILLYSSDNDMSGNNITDNGKAIWLWDSSDNGISANNITNNWYGILLEDSSHNTISGNNITANHWDGINLRRSSSNTIFGNNIIDNKYGITLYLSSANIIYNNNFVDNSEQVLASRLDSTNVWEDSYPSGGSYWSDYTGVDVKSGPNQDQTSSDGIGDTPYIIDANNQDRYPLMISSAPVEEVPEEKIPFWMQWWFWAIVAVGIVVSAGAVYLKKRKLPNLSLKYLGEQEEP